MPASNPLAGEVWLCARHPPQYQPPPGLPVECPFYCLVHGLEQSPYPAPPDRVVVVCPCPDTPREVGTPSLRYVSIPRELFLELFEFQSLATDLTRELIVFLDTWRREQRALTPEDTYRMHPYRALTQRLIPLPEEPMVMQPRPMPRLALPRGVDDILRTMAQIIGSPASGAHAQPPDVPQEPARTQWEHLLDDED